MSTIQRSRVGLALAFLAFAGVITGGILTPTPLSHDAASMLDSGASWAYMTWPPLAMVATFLIRRWLRPTAWEVLGPARPLRWQLSWLLPTLLLPAAGSILGSAVVVVLAADRAPDLTSLVVYTLAPALGVLLVVSVSIAAERAVAGRTAPLVAGIATAVLIILAPNLLYRLGATLALGGTRPEPAWPFPFLAMLACALGLAAHVAMRLTPRTTAIGLGAAVVVGVLVSTTLPGRLLDPVGAPQSCVGSRPRVCSYPQYISWMDATAGTAGQIHRFATEQGIELPVTLVVQSAADTHADPAPDVARFQVTARDAMTGVPALRLADGLLGSYDCYEQDSPYSRDTDDRRAIAAWLAAEGSDDEAARRQLAEVAPGFSQLSVSGKVAVAKRVQQKVASCAAG